MKNNLQKNILLFCIGLFSAFYVRVIGSLIVSEIIIIFLFIYLFIKQKVRKSYSDKDLKIYARLLLLTSFSCIISALFRGLDLTNTLKGLFTILLLIPGLYVFYWLLKDKPHRIVFYLAGGIISTFLTINYFPDFTMYSVNNFMSIEEAMKEQWTYVYLPYFLFAIAVLYRKYPKITVVLMIAMGLWLLYGMSRRFFLIFVTSAIILLFTRRKRAAIEMTREKKFLLILLIGVGFLVSKYGYEGLASNGVLGEKTQAKYEMQTNSKMGIASGRSDMIRGLITLTHHPIIGIGVYGSNVDDSQKILAKFYQITGEPFDAAYKDNNVFAHSSMLDWWIMFGILAVPFWIFVLKQCLLFFKNMYAYPRLTAYMIVCVGTLLWDIFFSPFANRISYASILILLIIIKSHKSQYKHENEISAVYSNCNV